ncbi:hypothetical protein K491DRAFT_692532 [Lophiostoma macrostomum CBS 122681]|uniref:Uncharacterized protein n=1 Tax=Lophiostoma macrostomum CBS 122681 TaxID=1314788 RepID=A0A6A6T7B3_9PLEO|nr:hypothetical protein K491DRAFT_692532 [Lophiostoma macrostomum CBS 122681]
MSNSLQASRINLLWSGIDRYTNPILIPHVHLTLPTLHHSTIRTDSLPAQHSTISPLATTIPSVHPQPPFHPTTTRLGAHSPAVTTPTL